jgi:glycosyltransferase involved in cell wall biosynthesis
MPLISVIIPVYKVEDYLHQCVNSVLSQNFKDIEIILVDDGSPDNCPHICDEFAKIDSRINVIHKINGGSSDARNEGMKISKGNYIIFLDSDDYWKDYDFLDSLVRVILHEKGVEVINFGFVKYYSRTNRYIKDKRDFSVVNQIKKGTSDYVKRLLQNDLYIASPWNKCIKRNFILDNQLFFKKGLRSEDMAWCGDILFLMPNMTCLNVHSYIYRQELANSVSNSVNESHINDIIDMIKTALKKAEILNYEERYYYLSFYAVQYLTLLFNLEILKGKTDNVLSKEAYLLRSILNYDLNPKVKIANSFKKVFGYKMMSMILRIYIQFTQK